MQKKKNPKKQQTNTAPKLVSGSRKAFLMLALILWSALCIALYYLSIKEQLLWMIHVYMLVSLPCLAAAVIVNTYCNAKYTAPDNDNKPDPEFVKKIRNIIKALIIIGLPPFACVMIEYIAAWLLQKF